MSHVHIIMYVDVLDALVCRQTNALCNDVPTVSMKHSNMGFWIKWNKTFHRGPWKTHKVKDIDFRASCRP